MTIQQLSFYLGGVIEFVQPVKVDATKTYAKGDFAHITPAILWLVAGNKLKPVEHFKPHFRQLHQLTDNEARIIARLAHEESGVAITVAPKVTRNNGAASFTVEVHLGDGNSVVINEGYNVAVCEKLDIGNGFPPVLTFVAAKRQPEIFEWFVGRQFDVFRKIKKAEAFGRAKWTDEDYQTPEN